MINYSQDGEHKIWTKTEWQIAVGTNQIVLGYEEWVRTRLESSEDEEFDEPGETGSRFAST